MVYTATLRTLLVRSGSSLLLAGLCACGGQPSSFVTDSKPDTGSTADAQGKLPGADPSPHGSAKDSNGSANGPNGSANDPNGSARNDRSGSARNDPNGSSSGSSRGPDHGGPGSGAPGHGTPGDGSSPSHGPDHNDPNGSAPDPSRGSDHAGPGNGTPGDGVPGDGSSPSRGPDHGGSGPGAPGHGTPGDGNSTPHAPTPGDPETPGRGGETLPNVPKHTFEVVQKAAGKIDILWVVDNSASMEPEQRNVAVNFNKFITQLATMGHDFHTAITTTDVCQDRIPRALEDRMCPVREPDVSSSKHIRGAFVGEWGHTVLKSTDRDLVGRFNNYVRQGTDGSSFEHGLTAAHMAIDRSLHGKNEELVRNDAFLSVIVLSDEEDDGIGLGMVDAFTHHNYWRDGLTRYRYTDDDLIAYLKDIKGEGRFSISGIVGTRDRRGNLCSSRVASPQEEGTQYIKAAAKTGGIIRSVCELDWADSMLKIAQDVAAQAAQVNLPSVPDVPTIEVWVNGVASNDWSYNVGNNAVKFTAGKVPAEGATIKISYAEPQQ